MFGGPGDDTLLGRKGTAIFAGGAGHDFIGDGPFEESQWDVLAGGAGNDELSADNTPASRDIVSCGSIMRGRLIPSCRSSTAVSQHPAQHPVC
jgi:RTX calcium-binding nonapeptide repeat (4 copies)